MARLSQGLIQGLTRPAFGEGLMTGTAAGIAGLGAGRVAQEERAEQERVQNARNSMFAQAAQGDMSQMPQVLQSILSTSAQTGVDPTQAVAALQTREGVEKTKALTGRDKFVTVGKNVFDMETGKFLSPPTQEQFDEMSSKDVASLYEKFTPESVQKFIQNPREVLVPLEKEGKGASKDAKGGKDNTVYKLSKFDNVIKVADRALDLADATWAGTYAGASKIPVPSDARKLSGYIDTLKANLGFDQLQALRDASETGGALGQVSEMENRLLQSTLASLDPSAGDETFKENLNKVKEHYKNYRNALLGLPPASPEYTVVDGNLYYSPDGEEVLDLGPMTE